MPGSIFYKPSSHIFLFEVPTGIFADKFSRKKSIIAGTGVLFIGTVMMIFSKGFMMFAVIFALTGIGVTFMTGSVEALIYDALKHQKKTHLMKSAIGNYGFSSLMGKFVAPVIGAYIARDLIPFQFSILIYPRSRARFSQNIEIVIFQALIEPLQFP